MYFMIGSGEDGIWISGPQTAESVTAEIGRGAKVLEAVPKIDKGCFMVADDSVLILRGEIVSLEEVTRCPCGSGESFAKCHGATEDEPPPCRHDKVYSDHILTSNPPQHPWICRKCRTRGNDRGAVTSNDREYARLCAEPAIRIGGDNHGQIALGGIRNGGDFSR